MDKQLVSGYFHDDADVVRAVKQLREKNIQIAEVFTPFPIHGLDKLVGHKKSQIPTVGFLAGALGAGLAFWFQAWIFTKSYPMNIGGKPMFSVPTFIPVIFEVTVLFAAIGMVFAFLFRSQLGLGAENRIYDERTTDDRFLILLQEQDEASAEQLKQHLQDLGAEGIKDVPNNDEDTN